MIKRNNKGKGVKKYFLSVDERLKTAQRAIKTMFTNYSPENNVFNITNVTTNFRDTAKILGIREGLLVNWLLLNNYCYRDKKGIIKPYAKYMEFFRLRDFITESGHSGTQTLINSKGREEFRSILINEGVIQNNNRLLE